MEVYLESRSQVSPTWGQAFRQIWCQDFLLLNIWGQSVLFYDFVVMQENSTHIGQQFHFSKWKLQPSCQCQKSQNDLISVRIQSSLIAEKRQSRKVSGERLFSQDSTDASVNSS